MKVFVSWSGDKSKYIANSIKNWIPLVLQYAELFVSEKDISAGERWAISIAQELESSNFGIICLTPENVESQWILFEAGALSKSIIDGKVIPLLFGLEFSDLRGPLSQFQGQKADESGMLEIVKSINKISGERAKQETVELLVSKLWGELKGRLDKAPSDKSVKKSTRSKDDILEELVTLNRGLDARIKERDMYMYEAKYDFKDKNLFSSRKLLEEIVYTSNPVHMRDNFLILAGFVREVFPGLSELLIEAYRESSDIDPGKTLEAMKKVLRYMGVFSKTSAFGELSRDNKYLFDGVADVIKYLDNLSSKREMEFSKLHLNKNNNK